MYTVTLNCTLSFMYTLDVHYILECTLCYTMDYTLYGTWTVHHHAVLLDVH